MEKFPRTGVYRIRKSKINNKCVLQELMDFPYMADGHVDASIRDRFWIDVEFSHAPGLLVVSHEYNKLYSRVTDTLKNRESMEDFVERCRGF